MKSTSDNPKGCLFWFLNLLEPTPSQPHNPGKATSDAMPYEACASLLTNGELHFCNSLRQALSPDLQLMTKVRLADIVKVSKGTDQPRSFFNKISSKHVDFVACDEQYKPVLVIELDDRTHKQTHRKRRDTFLDRLMAKCSIPIVHIPARREYDIATLTERVNAAIS